MMNQDVSYEVTRAGAGLYGTVWSNAFSLNMNLYVYHPGQNKPAGACCECIKEEHK